MTTPTRSPRRRLFLAGDNVLLSVGEWLCVMPEVSVNIGTENSSLDRSPVTIGDIAGGNIEKRLSDTLWEEVREIKQRVKTIEGFLAGSLGEPGLTGQVRGIKDDLRRVERQIEIIEAFDTRLDKFETILNRYEPMWRAMEASYANQVTIPVYVFYGVMVLLCLSIPSVFLFLWLTRGG